MIQISFCNSNKLIGIVSFIDRGLTKGFVEFEIIKSGYYFFEQFIDKKEYSELFPSDEYLLITTVYIDSKYRNNGIAKQLLNYIINQFPDNKFVLNASPMEKSITLKWLIQYYRKFGFQLKYSDKYQNIMIKHHVKTMIKS